MLVYHISNMEDGALAKEMMEEQVTNKWPGLVEEVNEMCASMRIEDPKTTEVGKRGLQQDGQGGMSMERRSLDEGGDGET